MLRLAVVLLRAALLGAVLCGAVGAAAALAVHAEEGLGLGGLGIRMLAAAGTLTVASLPVWAFGLCLVGLPVWLVMRWLGLDGALPVAVTGALLAAAGPVAVVLLGSGPEVLRAAVWLAPIGATVGLSLRRRVMAMTP
ncbi:MAG: hypothetical protein AAFN17_17445 [Pseudomonadota bacterium]